MYQTPGTCAMRAIRGQECRTACRINPLGFAEDMRQNYLARVGLEAADRDEGRRWV